MLVCQGALSMATAATDSLAALIAVRGIMGATMAAFIPTIQSFLAAFFGKAAFSLSFSLSFSLGGALAQIVPVSALLLFLAGRTGWSEWRMFFVLWGVPSLLLAVPIVLLLPDGPRDASLRRFLSEEEHALLVREAEVTEGERQAKSAPAAARGKGGGADRGPSIARLLRDERVLILSVLNLTTAASMGGLNQWQPELLSADGRYSMAVAAVLNAIPAAGALPISILNARHSDATGERVMHSLCGEAVVLFGFLLSTVVLKMSAPPTALTVLMLVFIVAGDQIFFTPFSAYTADILPQALQASGMAIVSIGGSLGNILGPILIGSLLSVSGGFLVPFVALLGLVVVSLALIVALFLCARRRRRTAMALAAADAIELGAKPPGGSAEVQGAAGGGV